MVSVMKLAKKVKVIDSYKSSKRPNFSATPVGYLPVYVGEERKRFIIPTGFLSHPLFRMLLEKAYLEFGFEQRNGLNFPCTVSMFQEVVVAVKCSHGQFDLEDLVEEFIH